MTRFLSASVVVFALLGLVRAWDWTNAQASVREPSASNSLLLAQAVRPPSVRSPVSQASPLTEPASLTVDSRAASIAAIRKVFGHYGRPVAVARCESHLNARAVSSTGDYGLFQLHRSVWDPARNPAARPYWPRGTDWSDVLDPYVNARVAWAISRRGTDFWTHWRWSASCWS